MTPLYVYVSADCPVCARTLQLVANVRAQEPEYPIEVIDLAQPGTTKPAMVFGTPTYVFNGRILSLGNPTLETLLNLFRDEC
ncbi:thioredoxin family protein [Candidatus Chloroploca asiatica]|uniref:Thioredoxin-like fold domain-containing protein n=1 Tax=Candidatus Chloroploca asiatica TaxID=1506545 RepID=A0A2H3KGQ1_9CHLR|nr:thioredoxin family protein [Candidatus Chloroploca asiatica]PDV96903.1 hypothetical protein A9Q02_19870 [Candidatus Chloroploca asiatica]